MGSSRKSWWLWNRISRLSSLAWLKRLGWLAPNAITNQVGSVAVDKARSEIGLPNLEEPTYEQKILNQKEYKGDLKVGDYVYLDFTEKPFDKSFDISVLWVKIESSCFS